VTRNSKLLAARVTDSAFASRARPVVSVAPGFLIDRVDGLPVLGARHIRVLSARHIIQAKLLTCSKCHAHFTCFKRQVHFTCFKCQAHLKCQANNPGKLLNFGRPGGKVGRPCRSALTAAANLGKFFPSHSSTRRRSTATRLAVSVRASWPFRRALDCRKPRSRSRLDFATDRPARPAVEPRALLCDGIRLP
jgi:hypothetical protein